MPMSSHLQFAWDARKSSLTILRRLTAEPWETGGKGNLPLVFVFSWLLRLKSKVPDTITYAILNKNLMLF